MLSIIGLIIGLLWASLKKVAKGQYKLFGYTITIQKNQREIIEEASKDVVPFKKKDVIEECDLCHGEDLYINNSIMMCPKCQRNKSRVKSI